MAGILYVPSHTTVIQQYYHSLPSTKDCVLNYSLRGIYAAFPPQVLSIGEPECVCGRENSGPVRQFATLDFKL
jgi:hypothetical protein